MGEELPGSSDMVEHIRKALACWSDNYGNPEPLLDILYFLYCKGGPRGLCTVSKDHGASFYGCALLKISENPKTASRGDVEKYFYDNVWNKLINGADPVKVFDSLMNGENPQPCVSSYRTLKFGVVPIVTFRCGYTNCLKTLDPTSIQMYGQQSVVAREGRCGYEHDPLSFLRLTTEHEQTLLTGTERDQRLAKVIGMIRDAFENAKKHFDKAYGHKRAHYFATDWNDLRTERIGTQFEILTKAWVEHPSHTNTLLKIFYLLDEDCRKAKQKKSEFVGTENEMKDVREGLKHFEDKVREETVEPLWKTMYGRKNPGEFCEYLQTHFTDKIQNAKIERHNRDPLLAKIPGWITKVQQYFNRKWRVTGSGANPIAMDRR